MPNEQTQQGWLELELYATGLDTPELPMLTAEEASGFAAHVLRLWPSSPQGLAVKALVEALANLKVSAQSFGVFRDSVGQILLAVVTNALDAARKAGLT